MTLDSSQKLFIYNLAMDTWQNDLLSNSLFAGSQVGRSLRDLILAAQPVRPLTNPFEEAISGSLRADAATTRQNASNVGEAASMVGVAKTAVTQISDALADMEDIIDQINLGELSAASSVVQADFDALRDKIKGLVSGSDYNGIAMLDGSQWGTDQIDANGNVYIQAGKDSGFNVTFHNLDAINWDNLSGAALDGSLATQLSYVQSFQQDVDAVESVYSTKLSSLENQRTQLLSQADLLDQAVANRMSSASSLSTEQILLNLILGDSGSIVDESG